MMRSDVVPKKRKIIDDDDDDDSDDAPLAKIINESKKAKAKTTSDNDHLNNSTSAGASDSKKNDSDDYVPLFTLTKKPGRLASSPLRDEASSNSSKNSSDGESDSDDDAPLSSLKKKVAPAPSISSSVPQPNGKTKKGSNEDDDVPLVHLNKSKTMENPNTVKSEPAAVPAFKAHPAKLKPTKTIVKREDGKKSTMTSKEPSSSQKPAVKYELPGQKYSTPEENDPQRIFYQTMYKERKEKGLPNTLAATWVLTHGLLPKDEAFKLLNSSAVRYQVAGPPIKLNIKNVKSKGKDTKDINVKTKIDKKPMPKPTPKPVKQEAV